MLFVVQDYLGDSNSYTQHRDPGSLLVIILAKICHAIIKAVMAGANVTADFSKPGDEIGIPSLDAGNTPNFFSSWASTYDLQLKPDIGAPRGDIFSTWPEESFMVQSGTLTAAPYIAGIAALYIRALGGRNQHGPGFATEFNRRVVAAGSSLVWFNNTVKNLDFFAPPMQMGGGLANGSMIVTGNYTYVPLSLLIRHAPLFSTFFQPGNYIATRFA